MFLCFYNEPQLQDTLLLWQRASDQPTIAERRGDVARITEAQSGETLAINVFGVRSWLKIEENGQVWLSPEQQQHVQQAIRNAGFEDTVVFKTTPNFVVGEVVTCAAHPDSDHLQVTTVAVGATETRQIVCGAPNVAVGQKVVVAQNQTVMPDGSVIWNGSLRGVASEGMLCSARELSLAAADAPRGILVLPDSALVGAPFNIDGTPQGAS